MLLEAHDLKFFMLMLTVFILGFGVSSYSLLYGTKDFSWHLPREIVNLAYWQMFGELNALDTFERKKKNEISSVELKKYQLFFFRQL